MDKDMDALTRYRAMEAFCRQRAKMESEAEGFWLNEAQSWIDRQKASKPTHVSKRA